VTRTGQLNQFTLDVVKLAHNARRFLVALEQLDLVSIRGLATNRQLDRKHSGIDRG
jgi:hypothetical protein